MKPSAFAYHAPHTIDEATSLLAELGDGARVLAGGQSLIPMLSLRLAHFDHLVDIGRIPELRGIAVDDEAVVIGAMTRDAEVEEHDAACAAVPLLAKATPLIGHFQIRNQGTVGGSLAHADPAAEYPAVALALDATIEARSPRSSRQIRIADFLEGFWTTSLADDEILTSVRLPTWSGRCGFGIREFARRHGDFAMAGAVVAIELGDGDRIARCAISLFGLGPKVIRADDAEEAVTGQLADISTADIGAAAVADLEDVPSDHHGSANYRRRVGAAMVQRALDDAIREAADG